MRLEELKNEWPETPDFIHNMIQEEVEKQVEKSNIVPIQRAHKAKWSMGRVAAAAVACIIASSTIIYAGVKLYHMHLEKQETYRVAIGIQASEERNSLELPKEIHDISITSEYIPEGMEWIEKGYKSSLTYKDTSHEGGISIIPVLMDKNDLGEEMLDTNVVESEEHIFGSYEGVYLRYSDLMPGKSRSFNQRIYLLCPENYRILTIYIGADVSKEDAYKFAEGLVITEKEEMIKTADLKKWSDLIYSGEVIEETVTTNANIPIYQVGDTFGLSYTAGGDKDGNYSSFSGITVCVDDVQIADDLQLLKDEYIPDEWKSAVDQNGKLVQNHLSYVKKGDGIESLDEVVDKETVNQKLVYTTITYTNTTDKEINHMLYLGSLMTLKKQDNGTYTVYMAEETAGEGYDYYIGDSVAKTRTMDYYDVKEEYGNGSNYISSLEPGGSIQINMAWIVNETDLQNLYLDLSGFGTPFEIDENVVNTGLVYIGR